MLAGFKFKYVVRAFCGTIVFTESVSIMWHLLIPKWGWWLTVDQLILGAMVTSMAGILWAAYENLH